MENKPYVFETNHGVKPDDRDGEIAVDRGTERDSRRGPRVGDFILWPDGRLHRFSHDWGDKIQTSAGGSFYLQEGGGVSFSGGLDPGIDKKDMAELGHRYGHFWIFHHDHWGASRGVGVGLLCRVYKYTGAEGGVPRDPKGNAQELAMDTAAQIRFAKE